MTTAVQKERRPATDHTEGIILTTCTGLEHPRHIFGVNTLKEACMPLPSRNALYFVLNTRTSHIHDITVPILSRAQNAIAYARGPWDLKRTMDKYLIGKLNTQFALSETDKLRGHQMVLEVGLSTNTHAHAPFGQRT